MNKYINGLPVDLGYSIFWHWGNYVALDVARWDGDAIICTMLLKDITVVLRYIFS